MTFEITFQMNPHHLWLLEKRLSSHLLLRSQRGKTCLCFYDLWIHMSSPVSEDDLPDVVPKVWGWSSRCCVQGLRMTFWITFSINKTCIKSNPKNQIYPKTNYKISYQSIDDINPHIKEWNLVRVDWGWHMSYRCYPNVIRMDVNDGDDIHTFPDDIGDDICTLLDNIDDDICTLPDDIWKDICTFPDDIGDSSA